MPCRSADGCLWKILTISAKIDNLLSLKKLENVVDFGKRPCYYVQADSQQQTRKQRAFKKIKKVVDK